MVDLATFIFTVVIFLGQFGALFVNNMKYNKMYFWRLSDELELRK